MRKLTMCFVLLLIPFMVVAAGNQEGSSEEKKVELSVWSWVLSEGSGPVMREIFNEYEEKNPHVSISIIESTWTQAHDKLLAMYVGGQLPDVIQVNRNWLMEFDSLGILEDLTSYVDGVPGLREKFYEPLRGELNGQVLMLPYIGGNAVLVYNKQHFDKLGIVPPTTLDEFVEVGKILTSGDGNSYATQLCISASNTAGAVVCNYGPILYSFGGRVIEDGKSAFNSPEGVAALKWMVDLEKKYGIAAPGSITVDAKGMRESLASGHTFMNFDGAWGIQFYNNFEDLEIGIAPMPRGAELGTTVNLSMWGLPKGGEKNDEAWKLLEFMYSDEKMLQLFREANLMPTMPKFADLPEFSKHQGFFDTLANTTNYYQTGSIPQEMDFYNIIVRAYHEYFLGEKSAQKALDDAAVAYDKVIERFYSMKK